MDKIFLSDALKSFIKRREFVTDGPIFRLHHQVTTLFLIVCSILVSTTQFIGDPIQCIQTDDVPSEVLNTYCWLEGTYTLPSALNKEVGDEVVYPGVDTRRDGEDIILHAYYQWVCFALFLQAILFYLPKMLWSGWEGGRLKSLLQELHRPMVHDDQKKEKCSHLVCYFQSNMRHHTAYAFRYLLCEVASLVNIIGQIYFIDFFLGGEFTRYGLEVVDYSLSNKHDRVDPMIRVFPRLTKCTFHRFGSSGTVMKYDALCLLPLNILNEKIYIAIWFWFIVLTFLTALVIAYRIILLGWPRARYLELVSTARLNPREQLRNLLKNTSYGDWFILSLLAKNMDPFNCKAFLNELFHGLEKPHSDHEHSDFLSNA